jgi:hypothetical protein
MALAGLQWSIRIPRERFESLRGEESFRQALALGRFLNSFRFVQDSFLQGQRDQPAGVRQRITGFFFLAGVLYEGLELIKRMAKHFRHLDAWKREMSPILQDPLFDRLFAKSLQPLRNQAVFHFTEDSVVEPLRHCNLDELVFVAGFEDRNGELFYDLSDMLALDLFIDEYGSQDQQLARAEVLMERTTKLAIQLAGAAEGVLNEYVQSNGFTVSP